MNSLRISFTVLITSTVKLTYFKNSKLGIFIVKLLVKTLLAVFIMFFITTNHLSVLIFWIIAIRVLSNEYNAVFLFLGSIGPARSLHIAINKLCCSQHFFVTALDSTNVMVLVCEDLDSSLGPI